MASVVPADPVALPDVSLYDAIADPADLEVVFAIEALTNARIRDELGDLQLSRRRSACPARQHAVMAAFTHLIRRSRFSDGSYGVYYAAQSLETAIAEVSHHRAAFLARPRSRRSTSTCGDRRAGRCRPLICASSVRPAPGCSIRASTQPQALGRRLRVGGSSGVLYPSVRHAGGCCVGIFRPRALGRARVGAHVALHWDGQRITHWYEKRNPQALQ